MRDKTGENIIRDAGGGVTYIFNPGDENTAPPGNRAVMVYISFDNESSTLPGGVLFNTSEIDPRTKKSIKFYEKSSREELLAHELIGHCLGMGERNNGFSQENALQAIQVTNMYRRIAGKTGYRTGATEYKPGDNHFVGNKNAESVQDIPDSLQTASERGQENLEKAKSAQAEKMQRK